MSVRVKINPDAERQIAAMAQKAFKRFEGDLNRRRSRLQGRPVALPKFGVLLTARYASMDFLCLTPR